MKYHQQVDIRILIDKLRLHVDGAKAVNKRFSQWTDLEIAKWAFPIVTYASEMIAILDNMEEVKNDDYAGEAERASTL